MGRQFATNWAFAGGILNKTAKQINAKRYKCDGWKVAAANTDAFEGNSPGFVTFTSMLSCLSSAVTTLRKNAHAIRKAIGPKLPLLRRPKATLRRIDKSAALSGGGGAIDHAAQAYRFF
jgi:hypothetical protein